ncbi:CPBP family intramembrane glutamic endopeptidase [Aquirufa aurantiipilula]|uniref:CPBP family intramembrane metalloprotease n=1 Tax=Aquirufa aurantiipilula TaxID=2696561 RepID=A0ABT6BG13_9BACT|nr:CPBP family intramembrane glutamic endopeptidase [Aquirufa aurantiipilula]MBZ1327073.1 CPBP family intramembrane metalloprotease [Aquirufa aurantiipilula]MDF5689361.1 CPBP family intramembrane metalloprotease [Aquirufa aurantiipilula]
MEENYISGPARWFGLFSKLLSLFGFFLLGSFLGQFLGLVAVVLIMEFPSTNVAEFQKLLLDFMANPEKYQGAFKGIMALQWFVSLFTFVGGSWAYLKFIEKRSLYDLSPLEAPSWRIFSWAIIALLVSIPLMEYIIQWNQSIVLPAGYEEVEAWMRSSEDNMARLTKFLLHFETPLDFVTALAVIAGMAAIGEELFFRGVLQNLFERYLVNVHVAVWLSAAIFSFIHFQFYGFLPRMLLGAFFGYLYIWFRNIWLPILAHFFNNAWTLTLSYLYQEKLIDLDPEQVGEMIPLWSAAVSLMFLIYYIRLMYQQREEL